MLAHSEIGGTNNNNGTEGNWAGLKKAVCGTAGSTAGLPVRSVLPSLLRFLSDKKQGGGISLEGGHQKTLQVNGIMYVQLPSCPISDQGRLGSPSERRLGSPSERRLGSPSEPPSAGAPVQQVVSDFCQELRDTRQVGNGNARTERCCKGGP